MASTESSLPANAVAAPPTSTPANDTDDAARVIEKTTSDPRYVRGQTLLKEKRLEEAVVVYEDLLRTMIEAENQSDSLAVAPVYYQYGHSMLLLAEATASVFGGSVAQPEEGSGDGDAEQDAKNMADDLEVAWEMLEVARVIYSRYPDELAVEKELARVYMRLGDLGMESDVFEQAKADYEKSLVLRKRILQQTQDPDTTLLADLYCCLAISCIYQESKAAGGDGGDGDDSSEPVAATAPGARHEEIRKRENEGLQYYVLAGRVMAENIHRVAAACSTELQAFAAARIPKYSSGVNSDASSDAGDAPAKGKGKQKAVAKKPELLFTADGMDTLRDTFLACVQVAKALSGGGGSGSDVESLSKDEAQLLEYLEIYVELKEKVDGIIESASAEAVSGDSAAGGAAVDSSSASGAKRSADALEDAPVTTIGFGGAAATAAAPTAAAPVNVIAVKKRKVVAPEPTAAASSGDAPAAAEP